MREKGQTEVAKTLETPVFSRGIEILTEKIRLLQQKESTLIMQRRRGTFCIGLSIPKALACPLSGGEKNDSGYIFLPGKI